MPVDMEQLRRDYLRRLPSIDNILQKAGQVSNRSLLLYQLRKIVEEKRQSILRAHSVEELETLELSIDRILQEALAQQASFSLKRVINATGVIIHTNLGRSLLCPSALHNLYSIGGSYSNLEFDLASGERGSRGVHLDRILSYITGAEASVVVNNNAAAVFISLETVARDKEVIVSRGELVEIGGSFRIPDIMRKSGARLIEVGTTNKTYLSDYEKAIGPETALLLKVHTSNFRILGFTASVDEEELVALGRRHELPVMEDLGSGNLVDLSPYGLSSEPTVQEVIRKGVDIVTFSGDKLLGGPQAGIILGKRSYIEAIKRNPLMRVLRVDKLTIAALEATLRLYLDKERVIKEVPSLRMLTLSKGCIEERARRLLGELTDVARSSDHCHLSLADDHSQVGGGALPLEQIPTKLIVLQHRRLSPDSLERFFRENDPPILGRIHKDSLCFDLRTVQEEEEPEIVKAFRRLMEEV